MLYQKCLKFSRKTLENSGKNTVYFYSEPSMKQLKNYEHPVKKRY